MGKINKREILFYIVVGTVFVIALSILMSVRVESRSREALLFDNRNYEAAEEAYRHKVQEVLESYDCYNSGLTMTRVVSLDGEREYSMLVYNGKLQKLEQSVFEKLRDDVAACRVVLPDGRAYAVNVSFE